MEGKPADEDFDFNIAFDVKVIKKALEKERGKNENRAPTDFSQATIRECLKYLCDIETWEASRTSPYPNLDPAILLLPGIREALGSDSVIKSLLLAEHSAPTNNLANLPKVVSTDTEQTELAKFVFQQPTSQTDGKVQPLKTCLDGREEIESPLKAPVDSGTLDDKGNGTKNYFIRSDNHWRVRFNNGEEKIVDAKAPIKTLVEYLRAPGKIINPSEVYNALHGSRPYQTITEGDTMSPTSVCGLNRDTTKTLTATEIQRYSEDLSEMIERKNLYIRQGKTDETETFEDKIEKFLATLKAEYGAIFDAGTGMLISANRTAKGRNSAAENTQTHIKRAIEILKHIEELPEHLEKYLLKNKNIYQPPQDFQEWHIID